MIDKLSHLSVNDPSYATLYYQVVSKAPYMGPFFQTQLQQALKIQQPTQRLPNANDTQPCQNGQLATNMTNNGPLKCYFCGEDRHGLKNCQHANKMIKQNTLKHNKNGRLVWADNTYINRISNKTILEAINRTLDLRTVHQTNLIYSGKSVYDSFYDTATTADNDDEVEEDNDGYETETANVYPALHPRTDRKQAHEQVKKLQFNGVEIPVRPIHPQLANPVATPTPQPVVQPIPQPTPVVEQNPVCLPPPPPPPPATHAEYVLTNQPGIFLPKPIPINEDQIMDNPALAKTPVKPFITKLPAGPHGKRSNIKNQAPKLQSELQRGLNFEELFSKTLDSAISINISDLLGSSPQASKKLAEYLKLT